MAKKIMKVLTSRALILGLELLVSIFFVYFVYQLNILPTKYLIAVGGILVALILIFFGIIQSGKKKEKRQGKTTKRAIITKILSILVSIMLLVATPYVTRANSFFSNVTGDGSQKYVVSVIVLNSGKYKNATLKKLDGKKFGVSYEKETTVLTKGLGKLEEDIGEQKYTKVDTYAKLADSLYNGDVDAIVVGEQYRSMLETNHEGFDEETRVVKSYSFAKKTTSTTARTDVTENAFSVYITGLDTYGDVSTVSRSDVNLIVTVNPKTRQVLMVSIPRDTQINLHKNGKMDKLTHTGIYGTDETINTIEDFLNVKINYYAKTNFQGITNIVDAMGGITVKSDVAFTTRHGNYSIVKGENEMDGDKALCFVRERYNLPNGDFDRGKNQQKLLKALLEKAMSPAILNNYENILSAVEGSFQTDMSSSEIKSLIQMQLNDGSAWTFNNVQIQGEGYRTSETYSMSGTSIYVMKPYKSQVKKVISLIDKVEKGEKVTKADVKNAGTYTNSDSSSSNDSDE
ncbi:MAG: LCP family protein [Thomasclavelia sp.]|jgi:LCP family protein required for cell wall assembly|nr:LCP family protein [Thomasclavelia sp.]